MKRFAILSMITCAMAVMSASAVAQEYLSPPVAAPAAGVPYYGEPSTVPTVVYPYGPHTTYYAPPVTVYAPGIAPYAPPITAYAPGYHVGPGYFYAPPSRIVYRQKVYFHGQPVRNAIRAAWPY